MKRPTDEEAVKIDKEQSKATDKRTAQRWWKRKSFVIAGKSSLFFILFCYQRRTPFLHKKIAVPERVYLLISLLSFFCWLEPNVRRRGKRREDKDNKEDDDETFVSDSWTLLLLAHFHHLIYSSRRFNPDFHRY